MTSVQDAVQLVAASLHKGGLASSRQHLELLIKLHYKTADRDFLEAAHVMNEPLPEPCVEAYQELKESLHKAVVGKHTVH
jgi:hypothetical protein